MRLFKRDDDYKAFANEKEEKFAILKNVFLISFGFTLLFTAYNSAAALQSSVNKVRGIFQLKCYSDRGRFQTLISTKKPSSFGSPNFLAFFYKASGKNVHKYDVLYHNFDMKHVSQFRKITLFPYQFQMI